jgi:hypothetical protein
LAKIAHAYACAELGAGAFIPYLPKMILNKSEEVSRFVGAEMQPSVPSAKPGHESEIFQGSFGFVNNCISVKIRLFTDLGAGNARMKGTPVYWVIVGMPIPNSS